MSDRRLDGTALRDWAHTAVGDLITHIDEINRLNVFPVADADTGTNMLFTMRSALAAGGLGWTAAGDVADVAAALSAGALHGARGNSGVILSQILRGLADVTASAAADTEGDLADIDAALFGAALRHARRPGGDLDGRRGGPGHHRLGAAGRRRRGRGPRGRRGRPGRRRSPPPPTRPSWRWTRRPSSSPCWPTPVWSTPAVAACWSCWTR